MSSWWLVTRIRRSKRQTGLGKLGSEVSEGQLRVALQILLSVAWLRISSVGEFRFTKSLL
jgi:hypothetical protein